MSARMVRVAAAFGAAVLLSSCTGSPAPRPSASPTPARTTDAAWRRIADAPTARQEVAAAVLAGKIYVVGGLVASGRATDVVEIYDPATDSWTAGPRLPIAVHHAMAAALKGDLVVMGGFGGDLGGAATARVFILRDGRWGEGPPLRRPRGAGAAVTFLDRSVIVVGGISSGGHVAPVEIFDGSVWRDGAPIPSLRDHLGAAADGQKVYAAGGRRGGSHFATFEAYDVEADRWEKLPDMPTARSGIGAAALGSLVVTVGGEGPRIFPEVETFKVRSWQRAPDLRVPRHGVGVVAIGSTVYALVGGNRVGVAASAACEAITFGSS